jgi:hypothetical protein
VEAVVLGSMDIFIQFRPRVDPYFLPPMSNPLVGWQKVWFLFRNEANASLPMFMGSRSIPQSKWGYGVAQKDLRKLQPLRDVIQQLL